MSQGVDLLSPTEWRSALDALGPVGGRSLSDVLHAAATAVGPTWLVGGACRDLLLGRRPTDLDLACHTPLLLVQSLAALHGGRVVELDAARQVFRWALPAPCESLSFLDVAALTGPDITSDLAGRDLSINAMAVSLAGSTAWQLLDPHGGRADLGAGLARALGRGNLRSDPLRVLRLFRFAAELGFEADADSVTWAGGLVEQLGTVSPERIRLEWLRTLDVASSADILSVDEGRLACFSLPEFGLAQLSPAQWSSLLSVDARLCGYRTLAPPALHGVWDAQTVSLAHPFGWLRTVALLAPLDRPRGGWRAALLRRRFTKQEARVVEATVALLPLLPALLAASPTGEQAEAIGRLARTDEQLPWALLVAWALGLLPDTTPLPWLSPAGLALPEPWLDAATLQASGGVPGPSFGRTLERAYGYQLSGVWTEPEEVEIWLEAHLGVASGQA